MATKINTRSQQWYGWLPDLPDHRDLMYAAIAPRLPRLPAKVDLRPKCSAVENQGKLGSCTANALAGAVEFLEVKDGANFVDLSRLFIGFLTREFGPDSFRVERLDGAGAADARAAPAGV